MSCYKRRFLDNHEGPSRLCIRCSCVFSPLFSPSASLTCRIFISKIQIMAEILVEREVFGEKVGALSLEVPVEDLITSRQWLLDESLKDLDLSLFHDENQDELPMYHRRIEKWNDKFARFVTVTSTGNNHDLYLHDGDHYRVSIVLIPRPPSAAGKYCLIVLSHLIFSRLHLIPTP